MSFIRILIILLVFFFYTLVPEENKRLLSPGTWCSSKTASTNNSVPLSSCRDQGVYTLERNRKRKKKVSGKGQRVWLAPADYRRHGGRDTCGPEREPETYDIDACVLSDDIPDLSSSIRGGYGRQRDDAAKILRIRQSLQVLGQVEISFEPTTKKEHRRWRERTPCPLASSVCGKKERRSRMRTSLSSWTRGHGSIEREIAIERQINR